MEENGKEQRGKPVSIRTEALGEPARLQKLMAEAGIASRRKCEELISAGRVTVDGAVVTELGAKFNRDALIKVDGAVADVAGADAAVYVLLNKPKGCISSVTDPQGRLTVTDIVAAGKPLFGAAPPSGARLYPVGRLDYLTAGILLLTNDGEFANFATHPSNEVEKAYEVVCSAEPNAAALEALRRGVTLDDGFVCAPARVNVVARNARGAATVLIVIHEGQNRQVRRMFEAVGAKVASLRRVAVGGLDLRRKPYASIPEGAFATLARKEAQKIRERVSAR